MLFKFLNYENVLKPSRYKCHKVVDGSGDGGNVPTPYVCLNKGTTYYNKKKSKKGDLYSVRAD